MSTNFPLVTSPAIRLCWLGATAALWLCASTAYAHPVPKENHDRTLVVRLQNGVTPNQMRVRVAYRLEVDEETVLLKDMLDYRDQFNIVDYFPQRPLEYYAHYAKICAETYARQLEVQANEKRSKEFTCTASTQRLLDEDGKKLGHLRCDFVFESMVEIDPTQKTRFSFHDKTYWSNGLFHEPGQLILSVVNETGRAIETKTEPDAALRKRALEQPEPGDDDRLRKIMVVLAPQRATATPKMPELTKGTLERPKPKADDPLCKTTVELAAQSAKTTPKRTELPTPKPLDPPAARNSHSESFSLLWLMLHTDYGFWLTMLLAFLFGSAHALTPGHGKTLVAAYLVGERGTIWHAGFLGLVTTITHTGIVLILAIIITLLPSEMRHPFETWIQNGLGLLLGLTIVCMGFWLLLQRLAGRADHLHLDGGHHHHHHHGESASQSPSARSLSWGGLVVLGVTGGLIPCWDAIVLLLHTIGRNRFWLVLPAILAFSAGLAVVLVLIGILVVHAPRFVESRWGNGRLVHALPIVSAILVTLMGLWLCYEGVHGR